MTAKLMAQFRQGGASPAPAVSETDKLTRASGKSAFIARGDSNKEIAHPGSRPKAR